MGRNIQQNKQKTPPCGQLRRSIMKSSLGKRKRITDLRSVWTHEEYDFSSRLSEEVRRYGYEGWRDINQWNF